MKDFWNERYAEKEYSYGLEPNVFFKEQLDKLTPGRILLPADGECRNGVYAAEKGWEVTAFDYSSSAKQKAIALAEMKGVDVDFQVADYTEIDFPENSFDVIAFIFAHFHPSQREDFFEKALKWLKPRGHIIFEAFAPGHNEWQGKYPKVGGPRDPILFYSEEQLREYFEGMEFEMLTTDVVELNEGEHHVGKGKVVRMIARAGTI